MPAVGADVTVEVALSSWASIGQVVHISTAGYFTVQSKPDSTHISVRNLGYTGNAAPTTVIATSQSVSPGGLIGATGAAGAGTLNALSPTTTKGDIIVDNGANSPSASDVRFGVGTDGQQLTAVAAQPTGLQWKTLIPNAGTDNGVPRFDGATGTPIPLQTSNVVITDNGAIQASGSGGNARGADAVDLQVVRAAATQVASGTRAFAGAGRNNTVSAIDAAVVGGDTNAATVDYAFVGGGISNTASAASATVAGGDANTASGSQSAISGGVDNTASGSQSFIGGGEGNVASGGYSSVPGGVNALANKWAQRSLSAGSFGAFGDAQASELIWRISTIDATANVEMFLDGSSAIATIPNNTTWGFDIILVGRSSAGVEAVWSVRGAIHNNGGTTALTAAVTTAMIADGTGGTWGVVGSFVVDADNVNDALRLRVTGAAATNIRWTAHARIIEVGF